MKPKSKKRRLATDIKKMGRKARQGLDPNDRTYDTKSVKRLRRLAPEEIQELMDE